MKSWSSAIATFFIILSLSLTFYLSALDDLVELRYADTIISIKTSALCVALFASVFLIWVAVRLVMLPFVFLKVAYRKIHEKREKKLLSRTLSISENILLGRDGKAYKEAQKIIANGNSCSPEVLRHIRVLFCGMQVGFNVKLYYLQPFLEGDDNDLKFLVLQHLSQSALEEKLYHHGLELALKAYGIDSQNPKLISTIIILYGSLESWNKMDEMVSLLRKIDPKYFESLLDKIAPMYFKAGERFLGLGRTEESKSFFRRCLEYNSLSAQQFELMSGLMYEDSDFQKSLEIRFQSHPSFALFCTYYKIYISSLAAEDIYIRLTSLINREKNLGLMLSMANVLGLPEEAEDLLEQIRSTALS